MLASSSPLIIMMVIIDFTQIFSTCFTFLRALRYDIYGLEVGQARSLLHNKTSTRHHHAFLPKHGLRDEWMKDGDGGSVRLSVNSFTRVTNSYNKTGQWIIIIAEPRLPITYYYNCGTGLEGSPFVA
jgi:hypothetical protein